MSECEYVLAIFCVEIKKKKQELNVVTIHFDSFVRFNCIHDLTKWKFLSPEWHFMTAEFLSMQNEIDSRMQIADEFNCDFLLRLYGNRNTHITARHE